jgi:hypothetical protein
MKLESFVEKKKRNWQRQNNMKLDYEQLANVLLDFMCEAFDIVEVAEILINQGFSYDEILSLRFSQKVINQAQERINKGLGEKND